MTKRQYVFLFLEKLLEMHTMHPEIKDVIAWLSSDKWWFSPYRWVKHPVIEWIRNVFGKNSPDHFFNMEYESVNVISYRFPFIRLLNSLWELYYIHHNMLWDDTLYTSFMVPKEMIIEKSQRDIYLRK